MNQAPHYHPAGWLSGCYYLRIPPEIGRKDSANAGWLEFGRPGEIYQLSEPSIVRRQTILDKVSSDLRGTLAHPG